MTRTLMLLSASFALFHCAPLDADDPPTRDGDPAGTATARLTTPAGLSVGAFFGNVQVGSSASLNIGIENTGGASLVLSGASITGAAEMTVTGPSLPLTLAPGASSNVAVRFAPTANGAVQGTLALTSNAPNSPTDVALSGTGVGAMTGTMVRLVVSTSASRTAPASLVGAHLTGLAYIFTSDATGTANPTGVSTVSYWLDNPAMSGTATHVEAATPYDFVGTDDPATAEPFDTSTLSPGNHTLTEAVTLTTGAVQTDSATFTVAGASPAPDAGHTSSGGSGVCSPTVSGPGGAGSANVPGSNVPAFPVLNNAFTVTGLDATGSDDVGAIIQAAVNAHAQVIIPGSGSFASPHRYNVKTAVTVPAGVIIECQVGAEFLDATACTDSMPGLFYFTNVTASVAGAGLYGCMFKGTAPSISTTTSYNHSFIRLQGAHDFTVEGNFTTNSCGDADIRLDGPENASSNHGSTGNTIAFNDMEHAENGIALINAWNNTITCNTAFNGSFLDEEPNHSYAQCGENVITKNYMVQTTALPAGYQSNLSIGGNGTNCPAGSGVCATDTVTGNVINTGGFSPAFSVYCECNAAGDACDNSAFGGKWLGNVLAGGTRCRCGTACSD